VCGHEVGNGNYEYSEYIALYQGKLSPYNPSQIVYGDYLYTLLLFEAFLWRQVFLLKPPGFVSTMQFASWFLFNGRF